LDGLAKGSKEVYDGRMERLKRWVEGPIGRKEGCLSLRLLTIDQLLLYFTYERVWRYVSATTLKQITCAIKKFFKRNFNRDPFFIRKDESIGSHYKFEMWMRAVKREDAGKLNTKQKFPLTKFVLEKMYVFFDMNSTRDRVFWAILCLGVACLLRLSEVCAVKQIDKNEKRLKRSDLRWDHMLETKVGKLQLHDTKTKIYSSDVEVDFFEDGTLSCPVKAMELAFLQRGKGHKNESLFLIEKN
jgi:hypothetical protein